MRYPIGTCLEVHGASPWESLQGDYEVVAHTTIGQLDMLGIKYYDMYFAGKNLDETYQNYVDSNIGIYVCKTVQRDPFKRTGPLPDGDKVAGYIYFSDEILNFNTTRVLIRRMNLAVSSNAGNFDHSRVTREFVDTITSRVNSEVLSDYSDKYFTNVETMKEFLQPENEAREDDRTFVELKERLAKERADAAAAKAAAEAALRSRETSVIKKEALLAQKEQYLTGAEADLARRVANINMREEQLEINEELYEIRTIQQAIREHELTMWEQRLREWEDRLIKQSEAT